MTVKNLNMNANMVDNLIYFTFPMFEKFNFVTHAFSSRFGGVSSEIYSSLNLGFNRGDSYQNVYTNYKILCSAIDIDADRIVMGQLMHDSNIRDVTDCDIGKGMVKDLDYSNIDGLVTDIPNIPIAMTFADCVPIFFLDTQKRVIALAHSGWRGTVKKIGEKMILKMVNDYQCNVKDIVIGIGPSIGICCFEVGKEVYSEFLSLDCLPERWFKIAPDEKYYIDMQSVIKNMFLKLGILESNITVSNLCTKCNSDIFFSHRATDGKRGSMAAIIQLKSEI